MPRPSLSVALAVAPISVALSHCQCLEPVAEQRPDAQALADGGADAGSTDGGKPAPAACTSFPDCSKIPTSVPMCEASAPMSCIERWCVWECLRHGRTCALQGDAGCLACVAGGGGGCPVTAFCLGSSGNAAVEQSTCAFPTSNVSYVDLPSCRTDLSILGGPKIGTYYPLQGGSEYVATFPDLGGVCTGESLATGAQRIAFNCPKCQFVIRF